MRRSFEECREPVIALLNKSPFVKVIGLEITEINEGHAVGRIPLKEGNLNPYGSVHGGCLYALADSVAGTVANSCGELVMTVSGNMNFLDVATDVDYIYCEANLIRCGRSMVVVRAEIKTESGKLLDEGTFNFFRSGIDVVTGQKKA